MVDAEGHEAGAVPLGEEVVQLALAQGREEEAPREQFHRPPQRRLLLARAAAAATAAIAAAGAAGAAHESRPLLWDATQMRTQAHGPGLWGNSTAVGRLCPFRDFCEALAQPHKQSRRVCLSGSGCPVETRGTNQNCL